MEEHTAKVLLVEDHPWMRDVLRELLADEGHTVICAPSGEDGLRKADRCQPEVVLLDLGMPDSTDVELLHAFKSAPRSRAIPVIVVCALDGPSEDIVSSGAAAIIPKPFDLADLLSQIDLVTRSSLFVDQAPIQRSLDGFDPTQLEGEPPEQKPAVIATD